MKSMILAAHGENDDLLSEIIDIIDARQLEYDIEVTYCFDNAFVALINLNEDVTELAVELLLTFDVIIEVG